MSSAILWYFHDPMCSWCYGFSPTWQAINQKLSSKIEVRYVIGGLAKDSDVPMQPEIAKYLQTVWKQIEQVCGVPFNHQFWEQCQPRRSTYPACRAVIAAEKKGKKMINEIQNAYYQQAQNPSDSNTLVQCAKNIGLPEHDFLEKLQSAKTEQILQQQLEFSRQCGINGFPSLLLQLPTGMVNISIAYDNEKEMLNAIFHATTANKVKD